MICLLDSSIKGCPGDAIDRAVSMAKKMKSPANLLPGFGANKMEADYFLTKVSASAQVGHFFGLQRLSFS
jgi:hypothetical protein